MGIGSSKPRNGWPHPPHQHYQYPPLPPPPPPPLPSPSSQLLSSPPQSFSSSASHHSQPTTSNPPTISTFPPPPSSYVFTADLPHLAAVSCFPLHPPAPYPAALPCLTPPPHAYHYYPQHSAGGYADPVRVFPGRMNYQYYAHNQGGAWWAPPALMPHSPSSSSWMEAQQPPPPYVEHQQAVTIKNNVNLHKDTIRLERDAHNPDHYLVCFTFDSLVDGNISILYFAKEGKNCSFSSLCPDICMPVRVPFRKGIGQKFCQPSGSGIDLGFFELDDLSKPSQEDAFPLIVSAEACPKPSRTREGFSQPPTASCAQITQAVIEKKGDGQFQVKVIKQILWVGGERYELKEIFGLANSEKAEFGGDDSGKECVICMFEPKDTAVLPCRHMCMCSGCAKALRLQSNKCPICRQPVEELMEIKVKCSPVETEIIAW